MALFIGFTVQLYADEKNGDNCSGKEKVLVEWDGSFIHPGMAHSLEEIKFVKGKISMDAEPWTEAWKIMLASDYAKLSWDPKPFEHVERGAYNKPDIGSSEFMRDGTAAYTHALVWILSGQEEHAKKSAEIINAWSFTLKTISNHDARLLVGMTGHQYCNAAEILKHTWNGWPEQDQDRFRKMLREIFYPVIKDFYPSANGNWDGAMIQTMMAMGVFLEDHSMFKRAADYLVSGKGNGAIPNYFNEFGECQESGRDQGHTQMGLEYIVNACEIAWKQGIDLYSTADNRLAKGFEYTAKYNLGYEVPYEPYISYEERYHYPKISEKGRGRLRPMYEKAYNHYSNRRGLEMPFTKMAVQKTRPEKGGVSSLPWATLMYAGK